jgi:hypothetical protein
MMRAMKTLLLGLTLGLAVASAHAQLRAGGEHNSTHANAIPRTTAA